MGHRTLHDRMSMLDRVNSGKIIQSDIKHSWLLTQDQIASIPPGHVFSWIKQGNWEYKHFMKWLESFSEEE